MLFINNSGDEFDVIFSIFLFNKGFIFNLLILKYFLFILNILLLNDKNLGIFNYELYEFDFRLLI